MRTYKKRGSRVKLSDGEYTYKSLSLERKLAEQIREVDKCVNYEPYKISYVTPPKLHKYTPDFVLKNGIIIEAKGRFVLADRQKHLLIREQHPEYDIRFVFQNARAPIRKGSKTTYEIWAEKHGFRWANGYIPKSWFEEE